MSAAIATGRFSAAQPIRLQPGQRIRALAPLRVGMADGTISIRQPGDEVPEAATWPHGMAWVAQKRLEIVEPVELTEHDLSGEATVEHRHADGKKHRPKRKG